MNDVFESAIKIFKVFFLTVVVIALAILVIVIVRSCANKLKQKQTLKDIKKGKRKELGVAS
jgi:Na+-transporting NADH:ubiquinone oxidoreductase subunit NqrC